MGPRVPERVRQALTAIAYIPVCLAAAAMGGVNPFAGLILPMFVTVVTIRRPRRFSAVLAAVTPLLASPFVSFFSGGDAARYVTASVWFGAVALAGWSMGAAIRGSWTYGRGLAWAAGLTGIATVAYIAAAWDLWIAAGKTLHTELTAQMTRGGQFDEMPPASADALRAAIEAIFVVHWGAVGVGSVVASIIVAYALWLALANRWARWRGSPGLRSGLTEFRPPELLVWAVIAGLAAYMLEGRWSHETVRLIGWNGLIVLGAIYWVNGLAVCVYAFRAFGASRGIMIASGIMMCLFAQDFAVVLCATGLFDTWIHFRRRFDANIAARRERAERSDDEW